MPRKKRLALLIEILTTLKSVRESSQVQECCQGQESFSGEVCSDLFAANVQVDNDKGEGDNQIKNPAEAAGEDKNTAADAGEEKNIAEVADEEKNTVEAADKEKNTSADEGEEKNSSGSLDSTSAAASC
jgi:hypothetical protein